jgi:hypothetical protein
LRAFFKNGALRRRLLNNAIAANKLVDGRHFDPGAKEQFNK